MIQVYLLTNARVRRYIILLDLTVFEGARNTDSHVFQYSWEGLCDLFEEASHEPWDRASKLRRLAYIPGRLNGPRAAANVEHLSFGSFDIDLPGDHPDYISFDAMRSRLEVMCVSYILATSTKSLADDHRYRLILRFDVPVQAAHHLTMWRHINGLFGNIFDRSTHDPSRLSFFPANWTGRPRDPKGAIINDWPAKDAFQAFACNRNGNPIGQPSFAATAATNITIPRPRNSKPSEPQSAEVCLSPAARSLLEACASMVPPKGSLGYRLASDPANPLYCGHQPFGEVQGGRMFRFLCRVAARSLRRELPISADSLFDLATAVNALNGASYRPDLQREVKRALAMQANHIAGA